MDHRHPIPDIHSDPSLLYPLPSLYRFLQKNQYFFAKNCKNRIENVKKYLDEFRTQFHKINEMCKENKIYPFFENPNDVRDSELTREDICLLVPEKELNNFFGVNSFYDYRPPVYEPEKD